MNGIEPMTPCLQSRCSPLISCLAHLHPRAACTRRLPLRERPWGHISMTPWQQASSFKPIHRQLPIYFRSCVPSRAVWSHHCLYTEIQRVNHVGPQRFFLLQDKCCMPELRSVQRRMDGFESEIYGYEMLRVTLYQFLGSYNYLHAVICTIIFRPTLIFSERVAKLHCSLSTHTRSHYTDDLPVNKSIHFDRWAIRYCATWMIKQQYQTMNWAIHMLLFLFYLGEIEA